MIDERLHQGFRPRDVAVLVRTNGDADAFLRALNVKGIPHRFSGSRGLYAREEVRLLVSFLRALAHPDDSVSAFYLAASELYRIPETDLLRLNQYARRKSRPLLEVLRGLPSNEDLAGIGGATRDGAAADAVGPGPRRDRRRAPSNGRGALQVPPGSPGSWRASRATRRPRTKPASRTSPASSKGVKAYGDVAEHDRVTSFVTHLDLLREAGDDPAVAEADPDEDAVHVLTVHKAKGLEFPVVFLTSCAEQKFPVQRRREAIPFPDALAKETLAPADAHIHEERRLFYVAMTRAKDELVLTSAADYGTARARKISRFVVEALDLPSAAPAPAEEPGARGAGAPSARPRPAGPSRGAHPREPDAAPLVDADRRLPHVPAQVPLRPHPPRPAPDPPPRRLRQRDPQGGAAALRGAPRGPCVRRGGPDRRVPRLLGLRRLPLPRARGAPSRGGGGDAAPLLPPAGDGPVAPDGRRGGVRVRLGR